MSNSKLSKQGQCEYVDYFYYSLNRAAQNPQRGRMRASGWTKLNYWMLITSHWSLLLGSSLSSWGVRDVQRSGDARGNCLVVCPPTKF